MLIFAGLGNPGAKYENNRHNVGFMAADAIARRHSFSPWSRKFRGLVCEGTIEGEKVLLVKPQTYMNLSGEAVGEALRFYKLPAANLTVFCDELDLSAGKLRIKTGGGPGGHNGIKSLDAHCGKDYRRVRIGIGHPGDRDQVTNHVLGDFAKVDAQWLDPLLEAVADHVGLLVRGDEAGFMNKAALAKKGRDAGKPGDGPRPAKGQSHIRQARQGGPTIAVPETGPMAAMLKRLFGERK